MDITRLILTVLSRGRQDGAALYSEVTLLYGSPPLHMEWRNLLIDLTEKNEIERHVTRDDDEKVLEVDYSLPSIANTEIGGSSDPASKTKCK